MTLLFNMTITNEGISKARQANETPGWYIIPKKFGVTQSQGALSATRTTSSMYTTWYGEEFSGVYPIETTKMVNSVVIAPDAYASDINIGEIYFIYETSDGEEFLFAIAQPASTLIFTPGVAQDYAFSFTLNNTNVLDVYEINYTFPQDIEDHNNDVTAHVNKATIALDNLTAAARATKTKYGVVEPGNLDVSDGVLKYGLNPWLSMMSGNYDPSTKRANILSAPGMTQYTGEAIPLPLANATTTGSHPGNIFYYTGNTLNFGTTNAYSAGGDATTVYTFGSTITTPMTFNAYVASSVASCHLIVTLVYNDATTQTVIDVTSYNNSNSQTYTVSTSNKVVSEVRVRLIYITGSGTTDNNNTVGSLSATYTPVASTATTLQYLIGSGYPNLLLKGHDGATIEIVGIQPDIITGSANGTFNIFVDAESKNIYNNTIYYSKKQPTSPALNAVWYTYKDGQVLGYRYDGTTWVAYNKVHIGRFTVTNGLITDVVNLNYPSNFSYSSCFPNYLDGTTKLSNTTYYASSSGYLFIRGVLDTNSYQVEIGQTSSLGTTLTYDKAIGTGNTVQAIVPILRGMHYKITGTGTFSELKFYPLIGD
jgi:hypothetical protein